VHEKIYDDVLSKLIAAYKQVEKKIGDPTDPTNLMGPLNSRDAVQAYLDAVEKAKASGGKVETGGAAIEGKGNFGFNAANDTYGDMIEMGILDPTKVTRTALQNAASVASLMLTTECMVAEAPKEDAPAMPGGGMGGMGGMGF